MSEPITVTIKNLSRSRALAWLGKGAVWADHGQEVTVDYEPWSCADSSQRICILAELSNHEIEFTMHLLTPAGVVDIAYNPYLSCGICAVDAPAQAPAQQAAWSEPGQVDSHIVVAGADHSGDAAGVFRTETVQPPSADRRTDPATGFVASAVASSAGHAVITGQDSGIAGLVSSVQEPVQEQEAENGQDAPDVRGRFNELCAARKWTEALQLLIDTYGQEKVSFTTRVVMAMKDFDAVAKKYGLE